MSREIKFRAWDEKYKQFADYEEIEECLSCQNRDGWKSSDGMGCCFGINAVELLADCIVEQYTGLKDKNGKEIYEGDIVEEDIDFNSKMTDGTFRYKVYWNEDELCWSLYPISSESIHNDLWELNSSRRVIGNIHENPELLGVEK